MYNVSVLELYSMLYDPKDGKDDMATVRDIFAKNLVRIMRRRKISVTELATVLGVNQPLISAWRTGKYFPTKYLDQIAEALRVQPAELFIDPDEPMLSDMPGVEALEALANSMGCGIYELTDKKKNNASFKGRDKIYSHLPSHPNPACSLVFFARALRKQDH